MKIFHIKFIQIAFEFVYYINYSAGGKIGNKAIFRFKNKSCSTNSGFKQLRRAVICNPASEKSLSLGTEVAGIDKYLRAIWLNKGNLFELSFHQLRGSHFLIFVNSSKHQLHYPQHYHY